MKINLITQAVHDTLKDIYERYPALTLQNNGYQYIDKNKLTDEEKEKFKEVENILKGTIDGFVEFSNFRLNKSNKLELRFQYKYDVSFTGVGYILLEELLNGFTQNS